MKLRLLVLLLCLSLLAPLALAQEAAGPVKLAEIEQFNQALLEKAMADELPPFAEDGAYLARGEGYEVTLAGADLSADSLVLSAALSDAPHSHEGEPAQNPLPAPRGILPGAVAEDLLAAFPNDNPSLAGTRDRAVLYIDGALPAAVSAGFLLRDGSRLQAVEHVVYYQAGGGVMRVGLQYTLEQGFVTAVRSFTSLEALSQDAAAEELSHLADLQEKNEYIALGDRDGSRLSREDLVMGGLDFLDADLATAAAILGEPANQERVDNTDGSKLVISQWQGYEAVFIEKDGQAAAQRLTVNGGAYEGPRGLRLGDTLAQVISRFEHSGTLAPSGGTLYGDAENQVAPYGLVVVGSQLTTVYYALDTQDGKAGLMLEFVDDLLVSMSLTTL